MIVRPWTGWRGVFATAALACVLPLALVAQQEIVEHGNRSYREGDYAGAIDAYEAVLAAGFESADLHYNLGNAHFKADNLGLAILAWERVLVRDSRHADALANLELARSLTVDAIEPPPRFWLFAAASWWVHLFPRGVLILLTAGAWLTVAGGTIAGLLARGGGARRLGKRFALGGLAAMLLAGASLAARDLRIGRPERGVILAESIPVRSAPAEDDDLTLFEVHEGARVRIDERAGPWAEIVLDDGKVGWIPATALEAI